MTIEGGMCNMIFQVAEGSKPLSSVVDLVDACYKVMFEKDGS